MFDSSRDGALQHVHEPPTPVRALRPEVVEAIERLILDLLAKAPDDRPASARQVFDRLLPFLPGRGSAPPLSPGGDIPDPTQPYRHPLAPRRADPAQPPPPDRPQPPPSPPDSLVHELEAAEDNAAALIDEERFTQAVRVLDDALDAAGPYLPTDHPQLLMLRNTRAAALFLGGDYRRALAALEDLADAYARVAGPDDSRVRACRKQVAYCHVELGETEAALTGFRTILDGEVRQGRGACSSEALELRHQIGILLLAAHRLTEAASVLRPLHDDLLAAQDAGDPATQDVRDLLTRIELARKAS